MENIYLMGAEQVVNAGREVRSAAEAMQRAAYSIAESADRIERAVTQLAITLAETREKEKP